MNEEFIKFYEVKRYWLTKESGADFKERDKTSERYRKYGV
jgi:predicted ATP-binding protein involved in virulence